MKKSKFSNFSKYKDKIDNIFRNMPVFLAYGSPSDDTLKTYAYESNNWIQWCDQQEVDIFDFESYVYANQYVRWLVNSHYSESTICIKVASCKAFYRVAHKLKYCAFDIFHDVRVRRPNFADSNYKYLTIEQCRQVANYLANEPYDEAITARNVTIFALMATEGLRTVEVHRMNDEDIDWDNFTIYIHGKGHSDLIYPSYDTMDLLDKYINVRGSVDKVDRVTPTFISYAWQNPGGRLSRDGIRDMIDRALIATRNKKKRMSCHMLRHSCATNLYQATKDIRLVQETLRQKNPIMTARYAHVDLTTRKTSTISLFGGDDNNA